MPHNARVPVIDDEPTILELLRINFEMEGFEVVCAPDGHTGLAKARDQQPDLIISDIMMPGLDGLELLKALRAEPSTAELPVILLSAKAQKADLQLGLDLGADDYVTKPFDPLELLDRVNTVLAKVRR